MRIHGPLLLSLSLFVAACAPGGDAPATSSMHAMVGFDPARFAGTWHEVSGIGRATKGKWSVAPLADGFLVTTPGEGGGEGHMTAPGRFSLTSFDAPLWVLWADADMRTVVLGTPDRSFAIILDRDRASSPDRLVAAREILGWNGYDAGALR